MLGVREAGGVAGGFQHELVFENFQFSSGFIESIMIGNLFGLGCGLGDRGGLRGAGKAVHDLFGIGQLLLESAFPCSVLLVLQSSLVTLYSEAGHKLLEGEAT